MRSSTASQARASRQSRITVCDSASRPLSATESDADGSFSFTNVPPGEYVVQVLAGRMPAGTGGTPTVHFGMQYVTITDADPAPVMVRAIEGSRLEGRIVAEGGGTVPGARAWVLPTDFDRSPVIGSGAAGLTMLDDGAFRIEGVTGSRRFVYQGGPPATYLKSAVVNGVDALDTPFDFGLEGKPFRDIHVVVGQDAATVTGRIVNERGEPLVAGSVVAFSTDRQLWYMGSQRVKASRPSQDGTYRIESLPPGEYWLLAIDGLDAPASGAGAEWQSAAVLETLAPRAQRVTLGPSEARTLNPRLVRR